jgi:hypothetical protein
MFSIPPLLLAGTQESGFNKFWNKNEKWGQELNKVSLMDCALRPLPDIELLERRD